MGFLGTGAFAASPVCMYVEDFSLDPALMQLDQPVLPREGRLGRLKEWRHGPLAPETTDPQEAADQLIQHLSAALVQKLSASGLPAERFPTSAARPRAGWLLQGKFIAAEQGHAAMQASIGFGAGTPHLEIAAAVSDLAEPEAGPFLMFGENSKHSLLPGGLITKNPYVIAAKFVLAKGATDKDVQKLADQLTEELTHYIQAHPIP